MQDAGTWWNKLSEEERLVICKQIRLPDYIAKDRWYYLSCYRRGMIRGYHRRNRNKPIMINQMKAA